MKKKGMTIYYVLFFIALIAFLFFVGSSFFTSNEKIESIKFTNKEVSINLDESLNLSVNIVPNKEYDLIYSSDNNDIVSIDSKGTIIGKKIGKATIKVTVKDYPNFFDTCSVIVLDNRIPVEDVSLDKSNETIFVHDEIKLTSTIKPSNASNKTITWTSSNSKVATVDNGIVKGLSKGEATITAISNNGHKASCKVKVIDEKEITISFVIQDKKAINNSTIKKSCKVNISNPKCEVSFPSVKINNGYELIGWNTDKNKTSAMKDKIMVNSNTSFYSITRKSEPIVANLIIQNDTATTDEKTISCYLYNGNNKCDIKVPVAQGINGNTFIGWSTDKNAKSVNYKNNTIKISNNDNLYSITKKVVTITYDPNEDSENNIKAEKLLFTTNDHTKCTSYNGNGCHIYWIPTIYSKGHVIHGFSNTPDGKCIAIFKTLFSEDTTLYARIYDTIDKKKVSSYSVSHEELYGNILVEIENGIPEDDTQRFINFMKTLYKDHPELFYFNGKVVLLTDNTYIKYHGDDNAGTTWTDNNGAFSIVYVRYNDGEKVGNRYFGTTVHEIGHSYNNLYNQMYDKSISNQSDINNIYNKYKNMSSSSRPLSDYAYESNKSEFFSEALLEVYRANTLKDGKEYYISEKKEVPVPEDLKSIIKKYLNSGKDFLKKIGRLS